MEACISNNYLVNIFHVDGKEEKNILTLLIYKQAGQLQFR